MPTIGQQDSKHDLAGWGSCQVTLTDLTRVWACCCSLRRMNNGNSKRRAKKSSVPALHHEPLKLTAVPAGCRVVAHLTPGDCVGEAALLAEGGTRSASIQAEKLVQVCTSHLRSRLLCCSRWACPSAPSARTSTAALLVQLRNAVAEAFTAAPVLLSNMSSCTRQGATMAAQQSGCVVGVHTSLQNTCSHVPQSNFLPCRLL